MLLYITWHRYHSGGATVFVYWYAVFTILYPRCTSPCPPPTGRFEAVGGVLQHGQHADRGG